MPSITGDLLFCKDDYTISDGEYLSAYHDSIVDSLVLSIPAI
jgi:hypothetical protein